MPALGEKAYSFVVRFHSNGGVRYRN